MTAWHEIDSSIAAGAELTVMSGDAVRPFERPVKLTTTLSKGRLRLPYRLVGGSAMCIIHDWIVARQLPSLKDSIDIIHGWPQGALRTIRVAKKLGIPIVMERCNAHTRYAFEVVREESERIGVKLPFNYEHSYDSRILRIEEAEFEECTALLCPSEFVVNSFLERGFAREKLQRFIYGVDTSLFYPNLSQRPVDRPFTVIFAGLCAVRKGLHLALEAWLSSDASKSGEFMIAGDFLPAYRKKLEPLLSHPSVKVLGNRRDLPELMRNSDLFVLPSLEEGFGLVCTEAMASGCVPLVSEACTDLCKHMENALVHTIGDVNSLSEQITFLYRNADILKRLRDSGIANRPNISWEAAGKSLVDAYRNICARVGGAA